MYLPVSCVSPISNISISCIFHISHISSISCIFHIPCLPRPILHFVHFIPFTICPSRSLYPSSSFHKSPQASSNSLTSSLQSAHTRDKPSLSLLHNSLVATIRQENSRVLRAYSRSSLCDRGLEVSLKQSFTIQETAMSDRRPVIAPLKFLSSAP